MNLLEKVTLCGVILSSSSYLFAEAFVATDCTKAVSAVEKTICASELLKELDAEMAKAYADLKNEEFTPGHLDSDQKRWLEERNSCNDERIERCVKAAYLNRLDHLFPIAKRAYIENVDMGQNMFVFENTAGYSSDSTALSIDQRILSVPDLSQLISEHIQYLENSLHDIMENDAEENYHGQSLTLEFIDKRLVSIAVHDAAQWADMAPDFAESAILFDREKLEKIKFSDLFMKEDLPKVSALLNAQVLETLNATLDDPDYRVEDTNPGMQALDEYWGWQMASVNEGKLDEWRGVGLVANDQGAIERFSLYGSGYDNPFSNTESGYSDMSIDARPLLPFIKPEYRDSFVK